MPHWTRSSPGKYPGHQAATTRFGSRGVNHGMGLAEIGVKEITIMIKQKLPSAYTLHLPQTTYLMLKLYAAKEGVRLGRHVTVNETIVEFIRAGLTGLKRSAGTVTGA